MPNTPISRHYTKLKQAGLDLGDPQGGEQDAGSGGKFQAYAQGRIYWHKNTGARELRGPILERYLQTGGPAANPATGVRELGFPKPDHRRTLDGQYGAAEFEWGSISNVAGTPLVRIFGRVFGHWVKLQRELGILGHPISDIQLVEGGQAAWFERGLIWCSADDKIVVGTLEPALPGKPLLVDPTGQIVLNWFTFSGAVGVFDSQAGLLAALTKDRYGLHPVGGGDPVVLTVSLEGVNAEGTRRATLSAGPKRNRLIDQISAVPRKPTLKHRQLYSFAFLVSGMAPLAIAPHCLYARTGWADFGLAHITDLHVSRRIEYYRQTLRATGTPESDIAQLNNFNDDFRAFVRYANHLHAKGLLDVIIATGDLVDYVREINDHEKGPGNFGLFEAILRGQSKSPDPESPPAEALRVPVFTSLGNHDYRGLPYPLGWDIKITAGDAGSSILGEFSDTLGDLAGAAFDLASNVVNQVPGLGLIFTDPFDLISGTIDTMWNHTGLNTTHEEAKRLMGLTKDKGKTYCVPRIRPKTAARSVQVDKQMKDQSHYYFRRINRDRSYVITLGANRIVMLDTRWDAEITTELTRVAAAKLGFGHESGENFLDGHPDCVGPNQAELKMVRQAVADTDGKGVVLVGMHAPPLCPAGADMANCLRETAHPSTDPVQVTGWLYRHGSKVKALALEVESTRQAKADKLYPGWLRSGTAHFHTGPIEDMLDEGTSIGFQEELAQLFAGKEGRPVTLVMCGHGHFRMEFRLRWDAAKKRLNTFTDYYLSNPEMYYRCSLVEKPAWWKPSATKVYRLRVKEGAPPAGSVVKITDQQSGATWKDLSELQVAPYADPLEKTNDPASWWQSHAPLVVQTAALGPCSNTRRDTKINPNAPSPNFQGCRILTVRQNVIQRVEYVGAAELGRQQFPLAWESSVVPVPIMTEAPVVVGAELPVTSTEPGISATTPTYTTKYASNVLKNLFGKGAIKPKPPRKFPFR